MIYVMSDIHGNLERFHSIMEQIDLRDEDTLYILGDVLDGYPDGITIFQEMMQRPNITLLRGDHEQRFLSLTGLEKVVLEDEETDCIDTLMQFLKLSKEEQCMILRYLLETRFEEWITVNETQYTLVHAAPWEMFEDHKDAFELYYFDADVEDFMLNYRIGIHDEAPKDMMYYKTSIHDKPPKDMKIIFGHTSSAYYNGKRPAEIWTAGDFININCGAGYPQGRLACLRLDDMKVFYSEEKQTVIG